MPSQKPLLAELKYWHCLARLEPIGPTRFHQLLKRFNSVEAIFRASLGQLQAAGLTPQLADKIYQAKEKLDPDLEWEKLNQLGIDIITIADKQYPPLLKEIYEPPFLLYYQGDAGLFSESSLAVVGTRKITSYGQRVVPRIVQPLVDHGLTIVSGLALGVDALAHQICLEKNGKTIAVLGSGLDQLYPAANRHLAQRIIKEGLLISEYPPGTPPLKHHFPYRNRIISGLSLGTIVIEGNEDSGSLITAKYALDQNREILAVPGNILNNSSNGTNKLIKLGARPITTADDVLEALNIEQIKYFQRARQIIPENPAEEIILGLVSNEPMHINQIIVSSGLDAPTISSTLSVMEIKGKVKNLGGNNYVLNG